MGPQAGGHEKERGKTTVDKGEKDKKSKKKWKEGGNIEKRRIRGGE